MSCSIGVNLLPFNGGVDFSEVKTYAMEITRKASLEQLGYDITDPDNPEKDYQGFHIIDDALCWNDFSGCVKHPDITAIVDQIVNRFPDVEFVYRWFQEGSMAEEQYIKGDVREELVSWFLDIGIDNPEALRKVRKKMPDVNALRADPRKDPKDRILYTRYFRRCSHRNQKHYKPYALPPAAARNFQQLYKYQPSALSV